jgi:hypothetical protein
MTKAGESTCKETCEDGYTTDGRAEQVAGPDGVLDPARSYQVCTDCDIMCQSGGTCKSQDNVGQEGDRSKCVTCGFSFPYFVDVEESCLLTCPAGYFVELQQAYPYPSACGICQDPCQTCRACEPGTDLNCDVAAALPFSPSAGFCTSCRQDAYFPDRFDDIESVE